jgi:hypothetical protein
MPSCARRVTRDLPPQRVVWRALCKTALGITTIACVASLGAAAHADTVTAGSVLQSTASAIAQQTGAHVVFVAHSSSSSTTERIVADVGTSSGLETLLEGKADVSIRLTPAYAYVSGDSSGLTTLFGLTVSQAKKLGQKWESWKAGTKEYSNLKTDLTMSSVSFLLPKAKGTKLSSEVADGTRRYVLKWASAATASIPALSDTLTISRTGGGLPIEELETATGVKVRTQLSKWNENVSVVVPPAASTVASSKITR